MTTTLETFIAGCREKARAGQDATEVVMLMLLAESVERHLSATERAAAALEKIAGAIATQQRAV